MKITYSMIAILVLSLSFACAKNAATHANTAASTGPSPVPTTTIPKNGNYNARGEVTKINLELGSLELNHEEIVGVMPAMRMEFYVKDRAVLNGLMVGDKVDFVLEYKHPTETIVSIKKIQ